MMVAVLLYLTFCSDQVSPGNASRQSYPVIMLWQEVLPQFLIVNQRRCWDFQRTFCEKAYSQLHADECHPEVGMHIGHTPEVATACC